MMSRKHRTAARSRDADSGLTLIEILVSLSMIGIIASLMVGVVSVVLRNNPTVEARTDAAYTLQGVVTWLPQDVDSTPPTGFDITPGTASGCTQSPGTNILRMEWTENTGTGPVRFIANYRHVNVGGRYYIHRVTCSGTGAGPLGGTKVNVGSSALPPLPVGWVPGQLPLAVTIDRDPVTLDVELVTVVVQTLDGKLVSIDSAPKNPANTLTPTSTEVIPTAAPTTTSTTTTTLPPTTTTTPAPTTTGVGPTIPTTSTTSTTTTIPATTTTLPTPCVVLTSTISPASVKNTDPNGNGKSSTNVGVLQVAVTISVTTNGYCTGLEARAQTGAPNGELFRNFVGTGPNYSVTFPGYPQGSSELWRDGSRLIAFYSPTGGPYGSKTLVVT